MRKTLGIIALAAVVLATGCSQRAPEEGKVKIGILQLAPHKALDRARDGFKEEVEASGLNVEWDEVNAQGDLALTLTAPQQFVEKNADLVYAIATPAAQGAQQILQSTEIPMIFNAVTDPVAAGLLKDVNHPEGKITGVSDQFPIEKQLQEFLSVFPEMKEIGVLYSTDEANSKVQIDALKKSEREGVLHEHGARVHAVGISSVNDVPTAMASLVGKIDGFFCIADNLSANAAPVIAKSLTEKGIVSFAVEQGPVESGLLMSSGVDFEALGHEAGKQAVAILKDKKPVSDLPVFMPESTQKVVNEETAKTLGLLENKKLMDGATSAQVVN